MTRQFRVWSEPRGWRWECRTCPPLRGSRLVGGLNSWASYWTAIRREKVVHPRLRCLKAIELHLWKYHREESQ